MGGSKKFLPNGGFSEYEYYQIGTSQNGIKTIKKSRTLISGIIMIIKSSKTEKSRRRSNAGFL